MVTYYYLFYSFIIYSFLGWTLEVLYHFYTEKRFVNRGFLYGPLCPMYGVTSIFVIIFISPFRGNVFYTFIGGIVIATLTELITGYLLELLFNTKWWDYSNERFNFKGYICLRFSLAWGLLSIVFIRFINPHVSKITNFIMKLHSEILYNIILVVLIWDIALTINGLIGFRKMFAELQEVVHEIRGNVEKLKEKSLTTEAAKALQQRIAYLGEIRERLTNKISLKQKIMFRAYPRINSKRFEAAVEEIKKKLERIKNNIS